MVGDWTINIAGKVYGPYTAERMRGFASEGRLAANSLVAREGTTDWHEANDEPEFVNLFATREAKPSTPTANGTPAAKMEAAAPQQAQLVIFVDVKSRVSNNFEQTILNLGTAYKVLPNVWIVATPETANAVRNRLVQELGKLDSLFVIDATRGKAAWFNFGPEADSKIRRIWQKTP
jgi:GYF domain 2